MDNLRKQLDEIDALMLELFLKRLDIIEDVAKYKLKHNIAVYDKEREQQIINNALSRVEAKYQEYYKEFINTQLSISKDIQTNIINKVKK